MFCTTNNPAQRRFLFRFMAAGIVYALTAVFSNEVFIHFHPTGPLAWLLAILPALGIVAQMVVFGLYLAELKDEFQRNVLVQSLLWGIGATLAVTTVWGFLEGFVDAPHLNPIWIYVIFCFFLGASKLVILRRYR